MSWYVWVAVAPLGSLAALARFTLHRLIAASSAWGHPAGTLAVNTSGALALGLITGLGLGGNALLLAGTATIGSYTTFSAWIFETQRLGEEAKRARALANVLLSVILGVGAVALGRTLGRG